MTERVSPVCPSETDGSDPDHHWPDADRSGIDDIPVPNGHFDDRGDGIPCWEVSAAEGSVITTRPYEDPAHLDLVVRAADPDWAVTSAPVPVLAGNEYAAQARVALRAGSIRLRLDVHDNIGRRVASVSSSPRSASTGARREHWVGLAVSARAPDDAVSARIAIVPAATGPVEARVSGVRLASAGAPVELRSPLHTDGVHGAALGTWSDGRLAAYLLVKGDPPTITVADAADGSIIATITLPTAGTPYGAFGLLQTADGCVHVAATNGHLYRYRPGDTGATDLGALAGHGSKLWRLAADPACRVYGGTYPGGEVFRVDPGADTVASCERVSPEHQYVRSIAVGAGAVWAGLGTPAALYRLDPDDLTRSVEVPLPEGLRRQPMIYDLVADDRVVVVRGSGDGSVYAFDPVTEAWSDRLGRSVGTDLAPVRDGHTFWVGLDGDIEVSNLTTGAARPSAATLEAPATGQRPFATACGWDGVTGLDASTASMIIVDHRGVIHRHDPVTGEHRALPVELPRNSLPIHRITGDSASPGPQRGRIHLGGFAPGSLGWLDIASGELTECPPGSTRQAESILVHDGRVWLGTYPGADVLVLDPQQPVCPGSNPRIAARLGQLFAVPQDRPFAMVGTRDAVIVGTAPGYGQLGGCLVSIALDDERVAPILLPAGIAGHSITALAHDCRVDALYVGTCIRGGLGATPASGDARLLRIDLSGRRPVWETPISGAAGVGSLAVHSDGRLWGVTAAGVFVVDPNSGGQLGMIDIAPHDGGRPPAWPTGHLECLPSGQMLCTHHDQVVVVSADLQDWTVLATGVGPSSGALVARDRRGGLYFSRPSTSLIRLARTLHEARASTDEPSRHRVQDPDEPEEAS